MEKNKGETKGKTKEKNMGENNGKNKGKNFVILNLILHPPDSGQISVSG